MAITLNETTAIPFGEGGAVLVLGSFSGDTSYPNPGGSPLAYPASAYEALWFVGLPAGIMPVWDRAANVVRIFRGSLVEAPNGLDLSARTFDFVAIRPG